MLLMYARRLVACHHSPHMPVSRWTCLCSNLWRITSPKPLEHFSFARKNFTVTKRVSSKVLKSPFERFYSKHKDWVCYIRCPLNRNGVAKAKMKPSTLLGNSMLSTSFTSSKTETSTPLVQPLFYRHYLEFLPSLILFSTPPVSTPPIN